MPVDENSPEARRTVDRIHDYLDLRRALRKLEMSKVSSSDLQFATTISCGRFQRFDGGSDTRLSAHVFDTPRRVVLNMDNPHIRQLMELLDCGKHALAAHFLFREVLFAKGQKLPVAYREQLLTRDLNRRFATGDEKIRTIEDFLESIGENIESL